MIGNLPRFAACLLAALASAACRCDEEPRAAAPAASAVAVPAAPSDEPPLEVVPVRAEQGPAPCRVHSEQVWAPRPNPLTGLTATALADGRVAVGAGAGDQPQVLVFDRSGKGERLRMSLHDGLSSRPEGARRRLYRVTPVAGADGAVRAYADYRDELDDGRARVVCGPVDSAQALLSHDSEPLLGSIVEGEMDAAAVESAVADAGTAAPPPAASAPLAPSVPLAPSATPDGDAEASPPLGAQPEREALRRNVAQASRKLGTKLVRPNMRLLLPHLTGRPAPSASAPPLPAVAPSAPSKPRAQASPSSPAPSTSPPEAERRELRDCRTFVGADGRGVWALGTELVQGGGAGDEPWSLQLVIQTEGGRHVVHSAPLGQRPARIPSFEVPMAYELPGGEQLLTARFRGRLHGWTLDRSRQRVVSHRSYAGGYPTSVRGVRDGSDHLLVTSQRGAEERFGLGVLRFVGSRHRLPSSLVTLPLDGSPSSKSEPSLAVQGKRRSLLFHEGDRRAASLVLVPVDDNLALAGGRLVVASAEEKVGESLLLPLADGRLLVVYLRSPKGEPQLVSKVLACVQ